MISHIFIRWIAALVVSGMVSCSLNPSWILNPNPYDWDTEREKFPDTSRNRTYFLGEYSINIRQESSGEFSDWQNKWKHIFHSLDNNHDNASLYKNFITNERRKRKLPELSFLK